MTSPFAFYFFFLRMHLFIFENQSCRKIRREEERGGKGKREREKKIFRMLILWLQQPGLSLAESGAKSSRVCGWGPSTCNICLCFFSGSFQPAGLEVKQIGHNLAAIWDAGITGGGLIHWATLLSHHTVFPRFHHAVTIPRGERQCVRRQSSRRAKCFINPV